MHASDDRGKTWQHVGLPGPMQWPQMFTCASGADCWHASEAETVGAVPSAEPTLSTLRHIADAFKLDAACRMMPFCRVRLQSRNHGALLSRAARSTIRAVGRDFDWLGHAGTYIIGCQQVFSVDNNVVITRMEDEGGAEWSRPVKLTEARQPGRPSRG